MTPTLEDVQQFVDPDIAGTPEGDRVAAEILSAHVQHQQWRDSRSEGEQRQLASVPITHIPEGFEDRVREAKSKRNDDSAQDSAPEGLSDSEREELNSLRAASGNKWTP